jgi:hypothetical protein
MILISLKELVFKISPSLYYLILSKMVKFYNIIKNLKIWPVIFLIYLFYSFYIWLVRIKYRELKQLKVFKLEIIALMLIRHQLYLIKVFLLL